MGEVAESDDEGQQPDQQHGSADGVAGADQPCNECDDPSADDGAPEDGGERVICDFKPQRGEAIDISWLQRFCANRECGKSKCAEAVAHQHNDPQPQSCTVVPALAQHQRYWVEGVLRKELRAAENDS